MGNQGGKMLKAIVTVLDENDRIVQANRLIFETDSKPVTLGIEHEFRFRIREMVMKGIQDEQRRDFDNQTAISCKS